MDGLRQDIRDILESTYAYNVENDEAYNEKYNFIIVFANTGKEVEGTLEFVRDCAINFNVNIIWVEARHLDESGKPYSKKGWKVGYKLVDFNTASRNGEPFEELISIMGIPSTAAPFCSDQLKRKPIEAYLKDIGFKNFYKAIGIRADELDRVSPNRVAKKIIYPLVSDFRVGKKEVLNYWKKSPFNLNIPKNLGNCDNCWKKPFSILIDNTKKFPASFDWWIEVTEKYGHIKRKHNEASFYRGGISIADMFKKGELSKAQLELFSQQYKDDDCSISCEVYK